MKQLLHVSIFLFVFSFLGSAQPYLSSSMLNISKQPHKVNFYDVQRAFNDYWKDKSPSANEDENAAEGGWQQFKRWEWFMGQRVFPTGSFPNPEILYREYNRYKQVRR